MAADAMTVDPGVRAAAVAHRIAMITEHVLPRLVDELEHALHDFGVPDDEQFDRRMHEYAETLKGDDDGRI